VDPDNGLNLKKNSRLHLPVDQGQNQKKIENLPINKGNKKIIKKRANLQMEN